MKVTIFHRPPLRMNGHAGNEEVSIAVADHGFERQFLIGRLSENGFVDEVLPIERGVPKSHQAIDRLTD